MRRSTVMTALLTLILTSCSLLGGGESTPDIPGKIVFSAKDDEGTSQIYTMKANGTDIKQLTHFDPSNGGYQPSWSPDGQQILFSSFKSGSSIGPALWVMDADGSNPHLLYKAEGSSRALEGNHARWSPDGSKVAFDLCLNCQIRTNNDIYLFDIQSKKVTQLTQDSASDTSPTWSPDGSQIAFVSNRDHPNAGGTDIYTIAIDNGNINRLTKTGNAGRQLWYSNGQELLYWSKNNLYKLNLVDKQPQLISFNINNAGFRPIALSSDGGKILLHVFSYANPNDEQSLQILDLAEKKLNTIYSNSSFQGADWYISSKN